MSSAASDSAQRLAPDCPRCGYDLRGIVASWRESCPLEGVCSECGVTFDWADLLNPAHRPPGWLIEIAPLRRLHSAIIVTWFCSFAPATFWRRMRMTYEPKWGRIAAYLVILLITAYIIFAAAHGLLAFAMHDHLERSYSAIPGTSVRSTATPREIFAQAMLLPWSLQSPGNVTITNAPGGVNLNLAINSPFEVILRWRDEARLLNVYLFALAFLIFCPLTFAILPASRKRAKVRWRHIARIAAYSPALLAPGCIIYYLAKITLLMEGYTGYTGWLAPQRAFWILNLALAATFLGLIGWWWMAARFYLRMPHALPLAIVVCALSALGALAIVIAFDPQYVDHLLLTWQMR